MKFSLLGLLIFVTVLCLFFGLASYGPLVFSLGGLWLALLLWELVQFGRELNRP